MSIMRSNGNEWRSFSRELDRFFDDFLRGQGGLQRSGSTSGGSGSSNFWAPAVDVSENDDSFVVHAELPGLSPDDISIELENNTLTLKGERKFERKDEKENYHFVERSYGSFYRSFSLPRNVDSNGVNADFDNGVLTISIPKAEEAKPRRVEIGQGSESAKGREIPAKGKTMAAGASES